VPGWYVMQYIDGTPVYSASDLVGFLACDYLTALERAALDGLVKRPHYADPLLDVLQERGREHEKRYLDDLASDGRTVREIDADGFDGDAGERLRAAARATVEAMAAGADVVYQATFFDGGWRGHADFLHRIDSPDRPSRFGPFHYEVTDTKLARHVKPGAVLQLCSYVDQLTALQGIAPERMRVALGGSSRAVETLRVDDYLAYYRAVKRRFAAAVGPDAPRAVFPPASGYPEPVAHCEICRWSAECAKRRRTDDHLSLVAGISGRQRTALTARGVTTLAALGRFALPADPPIEGIRRDALLRVREQARLQLEGRLEGRHKYELILAAGEPIAPDLGLGALPKPLRHDLFLDLEGDPYALDDGVDYLFGVLDGDGAYHAFWSTDEHGNVTFAAERRAFERCMDFVMERLAHHPELHVFHFGTYERTALGRLMGRHGTREDEVDRLLRGRVLVDLHRVVRQSLRASMESYSLKKLEPLYGFTRDVELRDAGSSIAVFEQWLELGDGERPAADHLERIERYNGDDVVSTARLRDWLESLRGEASAATGHPVPRPGRGEPEAKEELGAELAEVARLAQGLTAGVPDDRAERTPEQHARWLLAQLLSWHRREEKSFWWLYYHLKDDLTDAERIEANEPLGGLEYDRVVDTVKRSLVHRYRFPPQEHGVREGGGVRDPATGESPGTVVAIDEANHIIDLKRAATSQVPHPTALIPYDYYGSDEQRQALRRIATSVLEHGIDGDGPHRAACDLLVRHAPRVGQPPGAHLCREGEHATDAARRLVVELDRSTLAIQGPPGSGKTYIGARMIVDLVRAGRKVGVTANSHKVIANLLKAVCEAAEEAGVKPDMVQKCEEDEWCDHAMVARAETNDDVVGALRDGTTLVAAGTAWLWSRTDMAASVDVLFVDEAGQMSLANALAVSQAARSLILLGDPQQLDQPRKGSHPPGAERSALAHLLGDAATMPPERGLFLETTWRLHPDVCRFTSEMFYESLLAPEEHLSRQKVRADGLLGGTGLRFVPVAHAGNDVESEEEAEAVASLVRSLVEGGATWMNAKGQRRRITWKDVVIVAPFNAQVAAIAERLPPDARIGTVDKFQGQEAPVSIYSMTSSTADDAPRGMSFLYSRHRLNVATSRARCVAVIVASPALVRVRAGTPEQMKLANALCRFVEMVPQGA
jgi:predicted RecB family nuclease